MAGSALPYAGQRSCDLQELKHNTIDITNTDNNIVEDFLILAFVFNLSRAK